MADAANIIIIKDVDNNDCYPITSGEAITVQYGLEGSEEGYTLDDLLAAIFKKVITDILPADGVSPNLGSSDAKINVIYCNSINVSTVTATEVTATSKVTAPTVVASQQMQVNGVTISKSGSNLTVSSGIYGAVWN